MELQRSNMTIQSTDIIKQISYNVICCETRWNPESSILSVT